MPCSRNDDGGFDVPARKFSGVADSEGIHASLSGKNTELDKGGVPPGSGRLWLRRSQEPVDSGRQPGFAPGNAKGVPPQPHCCRNRSGEIVEAGFGWFTLGSTADGEESGYRGQLRVNLRDTLSATSQPVH